MMSTPTRSGRPRILALLAVLLVAAPADASNGSIVCRGADSSGRRVDGTCGAVQAGERKSCVTAGGTCTIDNLAAGSWTVTLRTRAGRTSPSRTVRVTAGASATVVLTAEEGPAVSYGNEGGAVTMVPMTGVADAGTSSGSDAGTRTDAGTSTDDGARTDAGATTAGSPGGTTSSGDAGTSIVARDAGTVETAVAATVATALGGMPPDRSTGTTLALQGRTSDARGRAVDGTVTATKDGAAVGRAATSGGRFLLYDLPRGSLTLTFRSISGATATAAVSYSGSTATVNLSTP